MAKEALRLTAEGNKKIFRTLLLKWSNFGIVKATYFYKLLGGPFQNWNEPALQSIISVYLCSSMRTESFVMHIILDFANTVDRGVLKPIFWAPKFHVSLWNIFFKKRHELVVKSMHHILSSIKFWSKLECNPLNRAK